ncbi:ciliary BBSome complex subunit 2 [Chytriomyces sp. MP71]|nr:ciliary BBSome complex subunit 2 [Chytriomyces sp. MP71]
MHAAVLTLDPLPAAVKSRDRHSHDHTSSQHHIVTIGYFDASSTPTLAYLTASTHHANSIAFKPVSTAKNASYFPHIHAETHVNQILAGRVFPSSHTLASHDLLVIASTSALWIFNVYDNEDVLHESIPVGVNSVCIGHLSSVPSTPIVFAATGDFLIQGYNYLGEEVFWTMTGDVPVYISMTNAEDADLGAFWVASEDCQARLFHRDECVSETDLGAVATTILPLEQNRFGFLLQDGSVGVAQQTPTAASTARPLWKQRPGAVRVHCIAAVAGLILLGHADGALEARAEGDGELVWADALDGSAVVAVVRVPDGDVICVVLASGAVHVLSDLGRSGNEVAVDPLKLLADELETLFTQRYALLSPSKAIVTPPESSDADIFRIVLQPVASLTEAAMGCFLLVEAKSGLLVHGIMLRYLGDSDASDSMNQEPAATATIQIHLQKPRQTQVRVAIMYSNGAAVTAHTTIASNQTVLCVHTELVVVPEFAMLAPIPIGRHLQVPELSIRFHTPQTDVEFTTWLDSAFLHPLPSYAKSDHVQAAFMHTPSRGLLVLSKNCATKVTLLRTMDVEVAATLLHSYAAYFQMDKSALRVKTNGRFGAERLETLRGSMEATRDLRRLVKGGAVRTEVVELVRGLQVHGESCLKIEDIDGLKRDVTQMYEIHRQALFEYKTTLHHQKQLQGAAARINDTVRDLASLHVGKSARVLADCREKLDKDDFEGVLSTFRGWRA